MFSGYAANLSDRQRARFYAEFQQASKQEVLGVVLALFLGGFGAHHFYMRRNGLGVLYLLLCWTGVPTVIGCVECFFMPGRVRIYNLAEANRISAEILGSASPIDVEVGSSQDTLLQDFCTRCGRAIAESAESCPHCGSAVAQPVGPQSAV